MSGVLPVRQWPAGGGGAKVAHPILAVVGEDFGLGPTEGGGFRGGMEGKELPGERLLSADMLTIQNIDHVVFRVTNLEKMIAFYTDVLGARFEKHKAAIGLYPLRVGTCLIELAPVDGKLEQQDGAGKSGERSVGKE